MVRCPLPIHRDLVSENLCSCLASSLSRHQQIQARLQLEIMDVKDEVARLKAELRKDQDPGKMSRIQTQIGVGVTSMKEDLMDRI